MLQKTSLKKYRMEDTPQNNDVTPAVAPNRYFYKKALLFFLVIAGILVVSWFLPIRIWLGELLESRALQSGLWGPLIFVVIYILGCIFLLPGSLITLSAGALFGFTKGAITVSCGSTLGACAAFLVGRFFAREWAARKMAGNRLFSAIDEGVGHEGFKMVFLLRLSPAIPFNLLNYVLGITRISFWKYAIAS